jgi:hypothetical protein
MRFIPIVLASAILFASLSGVAAKENEKGKKASTLFKDDQSYWNRLLVNKGYQQSMPPPTPRPYSTPPPTPNVYATFPPTVPEECEVKVSRLPCRITTTD